MEKKYLALKDITAYKIASEISAYVWGKVNKFDWFNNEHSEFNLQMLLILLLEILPKDLADFIRRIK